MERPQVEIGRQRPQRRLPLTAEAAQRLLHLRPFARALARLGAREERGDDGVADELGAFEIGLGAVVDGAEVGLGGVVDRLADALPRGRGLLQLAADEPAHEAVLVAAGAGVPVHRLDLVAVEADQAVAAFERVVEEGELVVAGERGEPEREPGEVHGHRVSVDAVEAALGHEPARQQLLVLVGRDGGRWSG